MSIARVSVFALLNQMAVRKAGILPRSKFRQSRSTSRSMSKGLRKSSEDSCRFVTGYEAGCLGFSLYNALVSMNVECVILAPSTMLCPRGGKRIKTDRRDARNIAGCLAYGGYSPVHVPSEQDAAVRDYIRMRDDHADMLRAVKQQVLFVMPEERFLLYGKEVDRSAFEVSAGDTALSA